MDYSRFVFAFLFVVGLIWAVAAVIKRLGLDQKMRGLAGNRQGRLQLVDVLYLDPRRKLMLVRADTQEYVLLLTPEGTTVVDKREGAV